MNRRLPIYVFLLLALLPAACAAPSAAESGSVTPASTADIVAPSAPDLPTARPDTPPDTCPVTRPPAEPFIPPEPYSPAYPYDGYVWYGTPDLWTDLPVDGVWSRLPYTEGKGYTQKIVFWNESYDWQTEQQPEFTLTGQRLDGDASSFQTDHATNGYHPDVGAFILTGVEIPTLGCWELTGRYKGTELTFVVWVGS